MRRCVELYPSFKGVKDEKVLIRGARYTQAELRGQVNEWEESEVGVRASWRVCREPRLALAPLGGHSGGRRQARASGNHTGSTSPPDLGRRARAGQHRQAERGRGGGGRQHHVGEGTGLSRALASRACGVPGSEARGRSGDKKDVSSPRRTGDGPGHNFIKGLAQQPLGVAGLFPRVRPL